MQEVTVLIAVEDPIVQIGLTTILECDTQAQPVGTVATPEEVRGAVDRLRPDVVLLDVSFRRRDEDLVPDLGRQHPKSRVLVLVDHSEDDCALRSLLAAAGGSPLSEQALAVLDDCCLVSLRASALGCVSRQSDPERLLKAVHTVASGEIAAVPWLSAVLHKDDASRPGHTPRPVTARELEVLALVAKGYSNLEVAQNLGIREQTVKNHLGSIMKSSGSTAGSRSVCLPRKSM